MCDKLLRHIFIHLILTMLKSAIKQKRLNEYNVFSGKKSLIIKMKKLVG